MAGNGPRNQARGGFGISRDGLPAGASGRTIRSAADALELELSLRAELDSLRGDFADHRTSSRQERLASTEAMAEATQDAYAMVTSAAAAGAAALEVSRDAWRAQGRVDGVAQGFTEGFADGQSQGRAEGFREGFLAAGQADRVDTGRADNVVQIGRASAVASELSTPPVRAAGARRATDNDLFRGVVESADVGATEQELRETFAAYVVSAPDQKLKFAEREKAAARETARGSQKELAAARKVLAQVLQVCFLSCARGTNPSDVRFEDVADSSTLENSAALVNRLFCRARVEKAEDPHLRYRWKDICDARLSRYIAGTVVKQSKRLVRYSFLCSSPPCLFAWAIASFGSPSTSILMFHLGIVPQRAPSWL